MIGLERDGPVWVAHFRSGENRFDDGFVGELVECLDRVEGARAPRALVTTGEGRFYSNGLNLDWLSGAPDGRRFMADVHRLLVRVLTFPTVTVAAVNGHAFAGGAMLATAHDFTVMRGERGYWCLPEVDLGLPVTPTMYAVLAARLPRATLHEALTTGRRYDAAGAVAGGIADEIAAEDAVLERAVARATELAGKDQTVIAAHRRLLYAGVLGRPDG